MTDNIEKTKQMIAVMQAYVDGKPIECFSLASLSAAWQNVSDPIWSWFSNDYRISTTPDSIDWSHVAPEWKFMARDESGNVFLYGSYPRRCGNYWGDHTSIFIQAKYFSSYRRGTCDWKESLVRRPE